MYTSMNNIRPVPYLWYICRYTYIFIYRTSELCHRCSIYIHMYVQHQTCAIPVVYMYTYIYVEHQTCAIDVEFIYILCV